MDEAGAAPAGAPTRIGIVGAGRGGLALLKVLHAVPAATVAGVCDIDPEAEGLKYARSIGIPVYPDVDALVREQPLEWLINVTHSSVERRFMIGHSFNNIRVIDGDVGELVWRIVMAFAAQWQSGGALATCSEAERRALYALLWNVVKDVVDVTQQSYDQLARMAFRDALTGLYTRRFLMESLDRGLSLLLRDRQPIALILADLDFFKAVNDRYGHEAGDELLRVMASLLNSMCRRGDLAARFGGEEFALVLPGASESNALACAERLRQRVESELLRPDGSAQTISIGLAILEAGAIARGRTVTESMLESIRREFIRLADEALYGAKAAGRNRVSVVRLQVSAHGQVLASGPAGEPLSV